MFVRTSCITASQEMILDMFQDQAVDASFVMITKAIHKGEDGMGAYMPCTDQSSAMSAKKIGCMLSMLLAILLLR